MILKHPLAFILTATLALGTFTACSNDDPAPMRPNLPATTGKAVRSISRLGSIESGYDWTFTYNDGRLTQAAGTLLQYWHLLPLILPAPQHPLPISGYGKLQQYLP